MAAKGPAAAVIPGMRDAAEVRQNIALMNHPIPGNCWGELRREGLIGEQVVLPSRA